MMPGGTYKEIWSAEQIESLNKKFRGYCDAFALHNHELESNWFDSTPN